jgi:hypothetical protein
MKSPWVPVEPMGDQDFAAFRRRAIFDCHKWDPQVGDACVIARQPLVIRQEAWQDVVGLASALARETLALEAELVARPELHRRLGLPRGTRKALRAAHTQSSPGLSRLVRFDFHFTTDGWRISEANADVPGGLNEASGFAPLVLPFYPNAVAVGDPASAYAESLASGVPPGGAIALVHATSYSDDQQMMTFIAKRLAARKVRPLLTSPANLRWTDGRASLTVNGTTIPLDAVVRFFPGDWLPALSVTSGWTHLFGRGRTPISNPATAVLVQSKRFPLVWDELSTEVPTWRALLPETRDPREVPWRRDERWVVKPALGRVGEGVGLRGSVEPRDWKWIRRSATLFPGAWIAQRRFDVAPIDVGGLKAYPCLGVYTVDARVVGAYGRLSAVPLIDSRAQDAAVLAKAA